jgi:hypothetical protein
MHLIKHDGAAALQSQGGDSKSAKYHNQVG